MTKFSILFPSTQEALRISDDIFGLIIDTIDAEAAERQRIKLIISELFTNAYLHGNQADPAKSIEVTLEFDSTRFSAIVKDSGNGLTRRRFEELTNSTEDFESPHGRGIKIISKLCHAVEISKDENGRFCIKMVKNIKSRPIPVIK
jgi:anti-sigma regulatory factor (Ser/Thr protein kinase)